MKHLGGQFYVGVKDHRYKIHLTEITFLRKRDPPKCLRTQYRVQNETMIRKSKKLIKNDNDELLFKIFFKNELPIIQQRKINLPFWPSYKRNIWLKNDTDYYCQKCEYSFNKQKPQIDL